MALGDQFKNTPHPDSDLERTEIKPDGSKVSYMNMLGCSEHGCNASFSHPMPRAWHIQRRHPGTYSGPSEDMSALGDMMSDRYGKESSISKSYTFPKGSQRPQKGIDY